MRKCQTESPLPNIFTTAPPSHRNLAWSKPIPTPNFAQHKLSHVPRQGLMRYIQQDSLVDNSLCVDYDPQLLQREGKLVHDLFTERDDPNESPDQQAIKPVQKRSVQSYYLHYKKLGRIKEQNTLMGYKASPYTALLQNSARMSVLPKCIGFIRNEGGQSELKLSNFKLGDKYATILSEGLASSPTFISQLDLSNNRISDKGAAEILTKLHGMQGKTKIINLSYNNIQKMDGGFILSLQSKDCYLQQLNLQSNRLSGTTISELLTSLSHNRSIQVVNLSLNNIKSQHGQELVDLITNNDNLHQLYLRWNQLGSKAGQIFFEALSQNSSLKVLDLSFNKLGGQGVTGLSNCLTKNKTLIHLDLSENDFNYEECTLISKALSNNHSIYGIHFGGNYGYIDSKGFLVVDEEGKSKSLLAKNAYRNTVDFKIRATEIRKRSKRSIFDIDPMRDSCWICEGWTQHQFSIQPDSCAWLHLSHQGLEGRYLLTQATKSSYTTMVPPGLVFFCYSNKEESFCDPNFPTKSRNGMVMRQFRYLKETHQLILSKENFIQSLATPVFDKDYNPQITLLPRFSENVPPSQSIERPAWKYQVSIWHREWKDATVQINTKCFERDWSHSKIPKLVKNPEDQEKVKALLRDSYVTIRNIYKHFAATSPMGSIWAITSQSFSEFCSQFKLIDNDLPIKIVDLVFITTNSATAIDWRGNNNNPERGLIRYQFMECLVRLSDEKLVKTGVMGNLYDALENLLHNFILRNDKQYDHGKWRTNRYFNEQCDVMLKKSRAIFEQVYKRFSILKVKPGEKAFMSLEQFKQICIRTDLASGKFQCTEKDALINYNIAMMVQVDQLDSDRIFRMQLIEFMEAFARMCDAAMPGDQKSKQQRKKMSLEDRLRWGIGRLLGLCSDDLRTAYSEMFLDKK